MLGFASVFKIKPEFKEKYKKDHDNIWPEMRKLIKDIGIENYSIFFKNDGTLFSYYESNLDKKIVEKNLEKASQTKTYKKWQEAMDRYFIKKNDSKTGPEVIDLEEVFHIY